MQLLLLLSTVAAVVAGPLSARQSQTWNDRFIKQPRNFQVTPLGSCQYQITFERDSVDSRYTLAFEARYGSTTRRVTPTGSNLAISPRGRNLPGYLYDLGTDYDLAVHQINGACSSGTSGSAPSGFRVFFDLDDSAYNYRNDWWSDVIAPASRTVPAVPQNVRTARASNGDVTVSWSRATGASSYFVLIDGRFRSSEAGDVQIISTRRVGGDTTSVVLPARLRTQRVAVVGRASGGAVSETVRVPDVRT